MILKSNMYRVANSVTSLENKQKKQQQQKTIKFRYLTKQRYIVLGIA